MKRIVLICSTSAFSIACSNDKGGEEATAEVAILGTWDATALKIDDATASEDAKNGRDALAYMTAKECYVITFNFKQDLTVIAENSVDYLEINITATGLDIPCPTEKDTDSSTYTFDGKTLAIVDVQGKLVNTNASIVGNILNIDAAGLGIPNFNGTGQLIFQKR